MPSDPHKGDSDQVLLWKIAELINIGGGGGGAGVASFNARTGAVTLELGDVTPLVDSRYVLKSGDTMTGQLNGTTFNASSSLLSPLAILTPTANTIPLVITGYSQTGASAFSAVDISGTWNTTGAPSALKVNITDTASPGNAMLIDLRVGNVIKFSVNRSGDVSWAGVLIGSFGSIDATSVNVAGGTVLLDVGGVTLDGGSVVLDLNGLSILGGDVVLSTSGLFLAASVGVGFYGAAIQTQQVSGADLTNNVTAGGTDDEIADYTDLTVYATDAAAIRDNIYQLARKLKQVNDALRAYGLLT